MQAMSKINCFGTSHSRPMTLRVRTRDFLAIKNTLRFVLAIHFPKQIAVKLLLPQIQLKNPHSRPTQVDFYVTKLHSNFAVGPMRTDKGFFPSHLHSNTGKEKKH